MKAGSGKYGVPSRIGGKGNPEYARRQRELNPKAAVEYVVRWQKNNPERHAVIRRERGWRRRGIVGLTWELFLAALQDQEYKCAVCQVDIDTSAAADHDHETGAFRACLCPGCNTMIGYARDNASVLRKGAQYLDKH